VQNVTAFDATIRRRLLISRAFDGIKGNELNQRTVPVYLPLEHDPRVAIDTAAAAFHLNRRPQTLRIWACKENGPIRPIRINGRLAWPIDELRKLVAGKSSPPVLRSI
jgi:hypothetical protein